MTGFVDDPAALVERIVGEADSIRAFYEKRVLDHQDEDVQFVATETRKLMLQHASLFDLAARALLAETEQRKRLKRVAEYARHAPNCTEETGAKWPDYRRCTCGLTDARAALAVEPGP